MAVPERDNSDIFEIHLHFRQEIGLFRMYNKFIFECNKKLKAMTEKRRLLVDKLIEAKVWDIVLKIIQNDVYPFTIAVKEQGCQAQLDEPKYEEVVFNSNEDEHNLSNSVEESAVEKPKKIENTKNYSVIENDHSFVAMPSQHFIDPVEKKICLLCHLSFPNNFIDHLKSHRDLHFSYTCKYCDTAEESFDSLVHHLNSHHGASKQPLATQKWFFRNTSGPYSICSSSEHVLSTLERNLNRRKNFPARVSSYYCKACSVYFPTADGFKSHLKTDHSRPENVVANVDIHEKGCVCLGFKCTRCQKIFEKDSEFEEHKRSHEVMEKTLHSGPTDLFTVCPACSKSISKKLLDEHQKSHYCAYCGEECKSDVGMREHIKEHRPFAANEFLLKCPVCRKLFGDRKHFNFHARTHGRKATRPQLMSFAGTQAIHLCSICDKMFQTEETLMQHRRMHFICSLCDREFADEGLLEQHTIACGCSFWCRHCSKKFSKEKLLRSHLAVCGDKEGMTKIAVFAIEVVLKCNLCAVEFADWDAFQRHQASCRAEVCCIYCEETFDNMWTLKMHLITHDDIDTFPCTYCDKVFISNEVKDSHIASKHSEKTTQQFYKCLHCGGNFPTQNALDCHSECVLREKTVLCELCGVSVAGWKMESHKDLYHTEVICHYCGELMLRYQLQKHIWQELREQRIDRERSYITRVRSRNKDITKMKSITKTRQKPVESKPLICELCGEKIDRRETIKRHFIVKHLGFKCSRCKQRFVDRYGFLVHARGSECSQAEWLVPFKCQGCSKVFMSQKHHCLGKKGLYQCNICLKLFSTESRFVTHTH